MGTPSVILTFVQEGNNMRSAVIKRWIAAFAAVVVVGLGASAPVVAQSLVQASEDLSTIAEGTVVDGAAFVAGDSVLVKGTVKGDLFCAGNTVTLSGIVEGDVLCAANTITLGGTIKGDVRVGANTVVLGATIDGSATLAAASVVTEGSSYTIGRDMTVGAGSVTLREGTIGRDLRVGASQVTLGGTIGRNVDASVESMTIGEGASIAGAVIYVSEKEASIADGVVAGDVTREEPTTKQNEFMSPRSSFAGIMTVMIFGVILFVVFALFIALVMPRYVRTVTARYVSAKPFLQAAAVGLATFLVIVPVTLMTFLSGVGALVGLFILASYAVALMMSGVLVAYRLGVFMVGDRTSNIFAAMSLGAIILAILVMIPFVGFVVFVAVGCVGLGMVLLGFVSQYENHPYTGEQQTPVSQTTVKQTKKK